MFCARADGWPADAEIVEVGVLLCRRRGPAIDLVLNRPREDRSQFVVTTTPGGREGIFWQTRLAHSPRSGHSGTSVPLPQRISKDPPAGQGAASRL